MLANLHQKLTVRGTLKPSHIGAGADADQAVSPAGAARFSDVDRTLSGQSFAAVERQFFEQGVQLEAEITAETEALREAADQPEGPRRRRSASVVGKVVVLVIVVAGVSFIGHRWFTGGPGPGQVAVAEHR